jgi:RNA polymerase sigma-70 factor (ECF subfamily)
MLKNPKKQEKQWQELMIASQKGDSKAYSKLLKELLPVITNFTKKRVFDKELVGDVVQNALLGIHTARHTYDPKKPFTPWMYAVTRYKILDYIRSQTAYTDKIALDSENLETFFSTETNTYKRSDLQKDLRKALDTLPLKQQQIVTLMKLQGFSASEVAVKLNMSLSAVKVAAHRAYKTLAIKLKEHNE